MIYDLFCIAEVLAQERLHHSVRIMSQGDGGKRWPCAVSSPQWLQRMRLSTRPASQQFAHAPIW